ncbi:hypothetical protein ASG40_19445 [Methylobacterium sp. Leaf399]|uniref:hypothetical protein n=1 Tax=Methylobacterium sp. Leaf399 TaxID=1736364 RepID=UPI0006FEB671|nr:hypothetical protein [Methylobacterium sp. Leaf399]KQT14003.1 hypothetical protein ASG40_19445 [Methylobacterium sp. Leaf399]
MIRIALAALALACVLAPPALAQAVADTAVPLPWGDWGAALFRAVVEAAIPLAATAIAVAAVRLPWWAKMWLTTQRVDRMVKLAADYAINAVEGAAVGKVHNVTVANKLLRVGLERAVGSTDAWVKDAAGGPKGIVERLFREFKFDETVSDANTLSPLIRDLPSLPFAR